MSGWWVIVLVLIAGAFGAVGILLYHSRMPELDRSASDRASAATRPKMRRQVASPTLARGLHAALGVAGLGGFLLATDRSHRGLGEAVVGITTMLTFLVSMWLKYLRRQEKQR